MAENCGKSVNGQDRPLAFLHRVAGYLSSVLYELQMTQQVPYILVAQHQLSPVWCPENSGYVEGTDDDE